MGRALLLLLLVVQSYAQLYDPYVVEVFEKNNDDFQTLVDRLWEEDADRAGPRDYTLDLGEEQYGTKDLSSNDLINNVNETLFERPVYSTLLALIKNNVFYPDECEKEREIVGNREQLIRKLFDTWTNTKVFKLAYEYLKQKGERHATSFEDFKTFLFDFWFGTFSRCGNTLGSSGFEHVFIGEWKKQKKNYIVDGHHSWVAYYQGQKTKKINYHGYYVSHGNFFATVQYKWETYIKKKGGFFVGTSPAFDFSLFTVCSLMYPNGNCYYELQEVPLAVKSFTRGSCATGACLLNTAYPIDDETYSGEI